MTENPEAGAGDNTEPAANAMEPREEPAPAPEGGGGPPDGGQPPAPDAGGGPPEGGQPPAPDAGGGLPEGGQAPAPGAAPKLDEDAAKVDQPPPEDPIQQAIALAQKEYKEAADKKEKSDSGFADVDGRLTALLTLQGDLEKGAPAYASAHDQLAIEQTTYDNFYDSEAKSLKNLLGPEAVKSVEDAADLKLTTDQEAEKAVEKSQRALAAATALRDSANAKRKEKQDRVTEIKQLVATIRGRHAKLRTMQDEITKAHNARQYGLAYYFLTRREYKTVLNAEPKLIEPPELPKTLLAAVAELADAEKAYADAENDVAKKVKELATAQTQLAAQKSKGEENLRDKLKQIPPTKA